jgi:FAD:protein FMN transferase
MKYLLPLILVFFLSSCNLHKELKFVKFRGYTQGTTYSISYFDEYGIAYQHQVDSILQNFDNSLSVFNPNSLLSKINRNETDNINGDIYFEKAFLKAMEVSENTSGAFDITVCPLVNAWGFGYKSYYTINRHLVDSVLKFVGYKKVKLIGKKIIKKDPGLTLDFNAIAQGYSVDIISRFLESKNISNYIVEIGGEVYAKGEKPDGQPWKVGIDKPIDKSNSENRQIQEIIKLNGKAICTSGNYRKFIEKNGKKFDHHIDPTTGMPANNNLISVSVLAKDGLTADGYGTAFMILGIDKTKNILKYHPELDVYLIFSNLKGEHEVFYTNGFKNLIVK